MSLNIFQSKDIHDYTPVLEGLYDDFGSALCHSILVWCDIMESNYSAYWEIYLIKFENKVIGICGLYSLHEGSTDELWLGWFGMIPQCRNLGLGSKVLQWMIEQAKTLGCKKIMSYVDEDGKPLSFYYRHGFNRVCNVGEYIRDNPSVSIEEFESSQDHIIELNINN
jgi:GNAT superfamily N-acetyltransferase